MARRKSRVQELCDSHRGGLARHYMKRAISEGFAGRPNNEFKLARVAAHHAFEAVGRYTSKPYMRDGKEKWGAYRIRRAPDDFSVWKARPHHEGRCAHVPGELI